MIEVKLWEYKRKNTSIQLKKVNISYNFLLTFTDCLFLGNYRNLSSKTRNFHQSSFTYKKAERSQFKSVSTASSYHPQPLSSASYISSFPYYQDVISSLIPKPKPWRESNSVAPKNHGNLLEYCVLRKFDELMLNDQNDLQSFFTYKVIAGIVMIKNNDWENPTAISIGTGSKFQYENCEWAGRIVDCHAEVIARRGLIKYLFEKLVFAGASNELFRKIGVGQYELHEGIEFYLYISTPPCGDARVFCNYVPPYEGFINPSVGILRCKGMIALAAKLDDLVPHDYKYLTYSMSCSDKLLKWNVVGIQGAYLSQFLSKPIYLAGVAIGEKYDTTHLQRAMYDRIKDKVSLLPPGYRHNNPTVYEVQDSLADPVQYPQPNHSVNWYCGSEEIEVLDALNGRVLFGRCVTVNNLMYSQISKHAFFETYLWQFENDHQNQSCQMYENAKIVSTEYRVIFD